MPRYGDHTLPNPTTITTILSERREYANGVNNVATAVTTYPGCNTGDACAEVDHLDGSRNLVAKEQHHFAALGGTPSEPTQYNGWLDNKESEVDYFAADGSTLLRKVVTAYQQRSCTGDPTCGYKTDPTYTTANILNLPTDVTVLGGSGDTMAHTSYAYDASALYPPSYSGVTGYDPPANPRGNRTSVSEQCFHTNACSSVTTNYVFDSVGNVTSIQDANGNTYGLGYNDNYTNGLGGTTYGHVTLLTMPKSQSESWQYDFYTGQVTRAADVNQVPTTYSSTDPLDRVTRIVRASGTNAESDTTVTYNVGTTLVDIYSDQVSAGDGALHTSTGYDGFGRDVSEKTYEGGSSYILTSKTYDALGRLATSTNPSRPGDGLGYVTTYYYDALGRPTTVMTYDGSTAATCYSNGLSCATPPPVTAGSWSLSTDQAGSGRQMFLDGLGRLKQVIEDPGSSGHSNYVTQYTYDALNNLLQVNQSGQNRYFAYDSLKRLVGATNPENYSIQASPSQVCDNQSTYATCYSYDFAGNLTKKTDNRGASIRYSYDPLNRVTSKSYGVPSGVSATPSVTYCYDAIQASGCPSVGNVSYPVGRLTAVTNGQSENLYTNYDALGRVLTHRQITAGYPYDMAYSYNRAGSLTSETYPSRRLVNTCYDGANRVYQVSLSPCGATSSTNYVGNVHYAPHGAPWAYTMGDAPGAMVTRALTYNSRLQTCAIQVVLGGTWSPQPCGSSAVTGGTSYLTASLNWYTSTSSAVNNGNLLGATYTHSGGPGLPSSLTFVETYSYDNVNRLTNVSDTNAAGTQMNFARGFGYDAFGNMYVSSASVIGPDGSAPQMPGLYNGNNQLSAMAGSYDAAGNQLVYDGRNISYDAENRQTSVVDASTGVNEGYVYDGDGKRMEKTVGGSASTVFVYDALGRMAAEYSTAVDTPSCVTCYLSADHLGTARVITDENGNVVSRHDYLPFGEEIGTNIAGRTSSQWRSSDLINQKFTGKERDSESGLDYFGARYYGSALGRFTSVDPDNAGSDPSNPQSWNAYSYVLNSPLGNTDPNGEDTCKDGSYADVCVTDMPPDPIQTVPFPQGPSQQPPTTNSAPVQPGPGFNAPSGNSNCVAGFAVAGAGVFGAVGANVGFDIGAVGGAAAGTLVEPGGGTLVGGVAGGVGGAAFGGGLGAYYGGRFGASLGSIVCASGGGTGGSGGVGGASSGGSGLSPKAKSKLGNLASRAGEKIRDVIRSRGGSGANVQRVGEWADRTLGEAAEAAVKGDPNAETAVKVAKQADRLGQQY